MYQPPMPPLPPVTITRDGDVLTIVERPMWLLLCGVFFGLVTVFGATQLGEAATDGRLQIGLFMTCIASLFCLYKGFTQTIIICDKRADTFHIIRRFIPLHTGRQATCPLSAIRAVVHEDHITWHLIFIEIAGERRTILHFHTSVREAPPIGEKLAAFLGVRLLREGFTAEIF